MGKFIIATEHVIFIFAELVERQKLNFFRADLFKSLNETFCVVEGVVIIWYKGQTRQNFLAYVDSVFHVLQNLRVRYESFFLVLGFVPMLDVEKKQVKIFYDAAENGERSKAGYFNCRVKFFSLRAFKSSITKSGCMVASPPENVTPPPLSS